MFANAVNLLPFTAVDEYGDLHVDISPSSVLLEVLTLGRGPGKKRTPRVPHVAPSGDPNIIRASPKSYLTYAEFKREQRRTGLGKGIEGHHLVEEQFAKVIGVSPGDILAVPLTPHWHRRTKQGREIWISGRNIDRMITKEMKRKGWRLENPTPAQVWAAHRKVYNDLDSELGSRDWAHAIYEAYFKPLGVPYDALMP
jgi:hypothetical protein